MNTLPRVMTVLGIFGFDANAIDVSGQSQNVAQPMSSWMYSDYVYAYNADNLPHGCYLNDDKLSVRGWCRVNLDKNDVLFKS